MIERATITPGALLATITSLYATLIIFPPSILAEIAQKDGWIGAIGGVFIGLIAVRLNVAARRGDTRQPTPEWIENVMGKVVGRLINFAVLGYFLLMTAVILKTATEVLVISILPRTPAPMLLILFAIPPAIGARLGIETIGRTAQLYLIFILSSYLFFSGSLLPAIEMEKLLPLFTAGADSILLASVIPGAYLAQIALIAFWLSPYLNSSKEMTHAAQGAVLLAGSFLVLVMIFAEGLFTFHETQRILIPSYELVRAIRLGEVVERLDILFVSIWLLGAFLQATLYVYLTSLQMTWITKAKGHHPYAIPVTALAGVIGLLVSDNIFRLSDFVTIGPYVPYVYTITVFMPVVLLVTATLRKKGGSRP